MRFARRWLLSSNSFGVVKMDDDAFNEWLGAAMRFVTAGDMHIPLQNCAQLCKMQVAKEFAGEVNPYGVPWEEWHFSAEYPPVDHKTLQASGALMASFITQHAGHVEEVGEREMIVGSELVYAGIHDQGATFITGIWLFGRDGGAIPPGTEITIPQRQIVGWNDELTEKCYDEISDFVRKGLGQVT